MLDQVPALVPGSVKGDVDKDLEARYGNTVAKALDADGKIVGYVIVASGDGFADKIELLIGLDPEAHIIKGMYVLSQKETPELGNKIVESDFRDKFKSQSVAKPISASKKPQGNYQIEAITGATISSVAVCNIINKGVADFKKQLFALAAEEAKADTQEGSAPDGE